MLLGVGEEVGELLHAELKNSQGIRGTKEELFNLAADAAGDITIYTLQYLSLKFVDVDKLNLWRTPILEGTTTEYVARRVFLAAAQLFVAERKFEIIRAASTLISTVVWYCDVKGINFEETVESVWNQVKQRNWKANPKTGKAV